MWTVGAQCAQFVVSIPFDLSRHFKVCFNGQTGIIECLCGFPFFVFGRQGLGLICFVTCLGLKLMCFDVCIKTNCVR